MIVELAIQGETQAKISVRLVGCPATNRLRRDPERLSDLRTRARPEPISSLPTDLVRGCGGGMMLTGEPSQGVWGGM